MAAITKLETANQALRDKIRNAKSEAQTAIYQNQLIKNNSMILDYKFRLKHQNP